MATTKKRNIANEDVTIFNRGECDFSFRPFGMSSFINIQTNIKNNHIGYIINCNLLRNTLMSDAGVRRMFEASKLYVEDEAVVKFLGLTCVDTTLVKSYEEIVVMLTEGESDELEAYLNELMDEDEEESAGIMIPLIERAIVDVRLSDLTKIRLIKEYTGKLVDELLEAIEVDTTNAKPSKKSKKSNKRGTGFEE